MAYDGPEPGYTAAGYGHGGLVVPDQSKVNVMFFSRAKQMAALSKERGMAVWQNVDYVRVQQPGEKDAIVLEAHDGHRQRWPEAYKAYQAGKKVMPEGTPLAILFPEGNEAGIMMLNTVGIFTVEQMAAVSDSVLGNIPFGGEMKLRAKRYVEAMQGSQGFNKMQAEVDREREARQQLERRMEEMQAEMANMQQSQSSHGLDPNVASLVAALAAQNQPRRRGRPPKAETVAVVS